MHWVAPIESECGNNTPGMNFRGGVLACKKAFALGNCNPTPYNSDILPPRPICRKARAGLLFLGV